LNALAILELLNMAGRPSHTSLTFHHFAEQLEFPEGDMQETPSLVMRRFDLIVRPVSCSIYPPTLERPRAVAVPLFLPTDISRSSCLKPSSYTGRLTASSEDDFSHRVS
jgi:hypothetical protein